ncbi:hypothetical protein CC80DRAFT_357816, partial [Byssothecium circinans]
FTYTFLCQNCTDIGPISFESTSDTWPIGWAMSNRRPTTPGSPSSALTSHIGGGSGIITAQRLVETGKTVLLIERGRASFYSSGGNLTVPWNNTLTIYDAPYMAGYLYGYPGNDGLCSDTPS